MCYQIDNGLHRILQFFGDIARKDYHNHEQFMVTDKIDSERSKGQNPIRWSNKSANLLTSNSTWLSTSLKTGCARLSGKECYGGITTLINEEYDTRRKSHHLITNKKVPTSSDNTTPKKCIQNNCSDPRQSVMTVSKHNIPNVVTT